MTEKERIDACLRMAEFAAKRLELRQSSEWKVTLGYWALLLGIAAFSAQYPLVAQKVPDVIAPISVLLYAALWLRPIWQKNEDDKAQAYHFFGAAERMLRNADFTIGPKPPRITVCDRRWWIGFLTNWSPWFQLITSACLAALLYLVLRW